MKRGLLHVYTGPGKGKTTAALGLILRSLGHAKQVVLVRLLKPDEPVSGELKVLETLSDVRVINAGVGILAGAATAELVRHSILAALEEARHCWQKSPVDLLVIDEINNALYHNYLGLDELMAYLEDRPDSMEIVLTGRNAPQELLARADLVTIMECGRHPMQKGIPARKGIEY